MRGRTLDELSPDLDNAFNLSDFHLELLVRRRSCSRQPGVPQAVLRDLRGFILHYEPLHDCRDFGVDIGGGGGECGFQGGVVPAGEAERDGRSCDNGVKIAWKVQIAKRGVRETSAKYLTPISFASVSLSLAPSLMLS